MSSIFLFHRRSSSRNSLHESSQLFLCHLSTSMLQRLDTNNTFRRSQIFCKFSVRDKFVEAHRSNVMVPFLDAQKSIQNRIQYRCQNGVFLVFVNNLQRLQGFPSLRCFFKPFFLVLVKFLLFSCHFIAQD